MNDKDKKEFFEKWLKIGVDPQLVWEWIESKKEEWEREARETLLCEDSNLHEFRLINESPSVTDYYQIHQCYKCGYRRKSNNIKPPGKEKEK